MTEKLSASTATMGDLFILAKSLLLSLADRDDPIDSWIKSFRLTLREDLNLRMGGLENNDMSLSQPFLIRGSKEIFSLQVYKRSRASQSRSSSSVFVFRNG